MPCASSATSDDAQRQMPMSRRVARGWGAAAPNRAPSSCNADPFHYSDRLLAQKSQRRDWGCGGPLLLIMAETLRVRPPVFAGFPENTLDLGAYCREDVACIRTRQEPSCSAWRC